MKTILNFKWYILSLLSVGLFASCLSDSDNEVLLREDLAYITSVNGSKSAATSYGYIVSSKISTLYPGEYYLMSYKLTNPVIGGVNQAEVLAVSDEPLKVSHLEVDSYDMESEVVSELQIRHFSAGTHFGDGWSFYSQAASDAKYKLNAYFYYDKENQIDESGKDVSLESNKVIIDVYFSETAEEFESADKYKTQVVVADLSELRGTYTPDYSKGSSNDEGKYVSVAIKFRYNKVGSSSGNATVSYLGSWNAGSSNSYYYSMLFVQK